MQFSAFGQEIHCETTATRKVTDRPIEIHTTAGTIDNLSIIDFFVLLFASDTSEFRTCVAEVSSHATD